MPARCRPFQFIGLSPVALLVPVVKVCWHKLRPTLEVDSLNVLTHVREVRVYLSEFKSMFRECSCYPAIHASIPADLLQFVQPHVGLMASLNRITSLNRGRGYAIPAQRALLTSVWFF